MRGFSVTINPLRDEGTPTDSKTIRYETLPAVDREEFAALGFVNKRPIGIGTTFSYTPAEVERSVLVPKPKYPVIVWPNGPARFAVDESYTFEMKTYRYTGVKIASTVEYGERIRNRYVFTLSGIPAAERRILRTAIESEDGYVVEPDAEPSSAFRSLVARFRPARSVGEESETEVDGPYLVRYDEQVYWTVVLVGNDYSVRPSPLQFD